MPTDEEVVATINEMVESGELIEETDEHDHIVYRMAPKAEVNGVSIFDPSRALDRAIVMVQEMIDERTFEGADQAVSPDHYTLRTLKKIMYALKQELENREAVAQALSMALDRKGMDPIDAMTKAITLVEEVKKRIPRGGTADMWLEEVQRVIREKW